MEGVDQARIAVTRYRGQRRVILTDREIKIQGRHSRRFYQYADELLKMEMSEQPNPEAILAARAGLHTTYAEVEA